MFCVLRDVAVLVLELVDVSRHARCNFESCTQLPGFRPGNRVLVS